MVRLKTRYLVVEVMTAGGRGGGGKPMQKEDIGSLIRESIARNYGDYGVGMLQYAFQGEDIMAIVIGWTEWMAHWDHSAVFQFTHQAGGRALRSRVLQAGRVVAGVCDRVGRAGAAPSRRSRLR